MLGVGWGGMGSGSVVKQVRWKAQEDPERLLPCRAVPAAADVGAGNLQEGALGLPSDHHHRDSTVTYTDADSEENVDTDRRRLRDKGTGRQTEGYRGTDIKRARTRGETQTEKHTHSHQASCQGRSQGKAEVKADADRDGQNARDRRARERDRDQSDRRDGRRPSEPQPQKRLLFALKCGAPQARPLLQLVQAPLLPRRAAQRLPEPEDKLPGERHLTCNKTNSATPAQKA